MFIGIRRVEYEAPDGIDIYYQVDQAHACHDSHICKQKAVSAGRNRMRFLSAVLIDKLEA